MTAPMFFPRGLARTTFSGMLQRATAQRSKHFYTLGIRREDKGRWERRVPVTPSAVRDLQAWLQHQSQQRGVPSPSILIQPSSHRIFSDQEYRQAGAVVQEDLSAADLIVGVKEVPVSQLLPDKTYLFFSHTHKGQRHNMPMLQDILNKNIRLMDYELLVDPATKARLVAFGKYAGYAGMINILHGVGHRMLTLGYSTPLVNIARAHTYYSLQDAKSSIHAAGTRIQKFGLPPAFSPLVFTFTGSGNVAQGAQEVFESLPHEYLSVEELKKRFRACALASDKVYGMRVQIPEYIRPKSSITGAFSVQDYFQKGKTAYSSVFHKEILPMTSVLVNGIYWDDRYPRLLEDEQFAQLASDTSPMRLLSIADISCDIKGSLEFMDHVTTIDEPFFYYDPKTGKQTNSMHSPGVQVMSIDNLPAELPVEASNHFSQGLLPFLKDMISGKENPVLKNAIVAEKGSVVPEHVKTITAALKKHQASSINQQKQRRILLLGSGRVAQPLVDYFLKQKQTVLTVGTNNLEEGKKLCRNAPNSNVISVDVTDSNSLASAITKNDLVISFVPAMFHLPVAKICLAEKKHMVTASYMSPELEALDSQARKQNITILNELGLDPGIDHLLAMKFMDQVREEGGHITSFVSWCGGLPAPEVSDNPLGYKFSWSPRGVLTAALNEAKFKQNGIVREVPSVLDAVQDVNIFKGFNFEGIPNRDSLKYISLYGLDESKLVNMFRGTLRYKGYSAVMRGFRQVGLMDLKPSQWLAEKSALPWPQLLQHLLKSGSNASVRDVLLRRLQGLPKDDAQTLMDAFEWLGMLSEKNLSSKGATPLDRLCFLLENKLTYGPGERDMICLHHIFGSKTAQGKEETHTSTLVAYGDPEGYTAMAKTVALPAAIGADLILTGTIQDRGVLMPTSKLIYEPILAQLEREGLQFVEKRVS